MFLTFYVASFGQQIIEHIVTKGETLESIARQYGISTSDITSLNPSASKFLYIGQKLQIKVVAAAPSTKEHPAAVTANHPAKESEYVTVQPAQPSNAQVQYIAFPKPKLKLAIELGEDFPVGDIYKTYNLFNFGQHYSLGGKLYFTDNLFASAQFEYQWFNLSGSERYGSQSYQTDVFTNFIGVPLRIGYGGCRTSESAFGISGGFWLGGEVGSTVTTKVGDKKEKRNVKGSGFWWAPMVSLHWYIVTIQYRAYFAKGADEPMHTVGFSFSF